jgi:phage portal protein BeeE
MAIVQSTSGLVSVNKITEATVASPFLQLFEGDTVTLAEIYTSQPEVRACVDFLARNISHLPIKAFERLDDNERRRISDGPLVATLEQPAPNVTKTKWLYEMVGDLAVYANSYHLKVRGDDGRIALVRIPPQMVQIEGNWLRPELYKVSGSSGTKTFPADQLLHIAYGYNPEDARLGLSPLDTLRDRKSVV